MAATEEQKKEVIEEILKYGIVAIGKHELIRYLKGEKLSPNAAIKAECYKCTNYYADGRVDCENNECPLYLYTPYGAIQKNKPKQKWTEQQKADFRERFAKSKKQD